MARLVGGAFALLAFLLILGVAGAEDAKVKQGDFEVFFKKLDTNMDGKLSKDEFLRMAERAKDRARAREKLTKVFEMLDPNNRGISKDQFKAYLDSKKKPGT